MKAFNLAVALTLLSGMFYLFMSQPEPVVESYGGKPPIYFDGTQVLTCDADFQKDPLLEEKNTLKEILISSFNVDASEVDWWASEITEAAMENDVPIAILTALVATESTFRHDPKGRYDYIVGPAQVNVNYWQGVQGYDLNQPEDNLRAGAYVLRYYYELCGSWDCATKAYNVGITNYNKGKQVSAQKRYNKKIQRHLMLATNDGQFQVHF